ncbi:DUF1579 domain-containing protein [Phenylobacterium sp.]|uniref:DUF1579 domain-containing protein n=1 Tax=Phenylobacterium sp. TaxID=1871053 RepID=UPI00356AA402
MGWAHAAAVALIVAAIAGGASAQDRGPPDPAALLKAQKAAMTALDWTHGRWQGPAWSTNAAGRHEIIQTERVGTMLDGSLVAIEGKSFETDGKPAAFNAFGIMSYDPDRKAFAFHSYAQGRAGEFPLEVTPAGYVWTIAAGPSKIRYTATHTADTWREVGEFVRPDGGVTQIFEMNLRRVGDTDWPMAGQAKGPQK